MSPQNPMLWEHPEAQKLFDKLSAAHLRWLKANPDSREPAISMEAILCLAEQMLRITTCEHCRRGLALSAIGALTAIVADAEMEADEGDGPADGEHVH